MKTVILSVVGTYYYQANSAFREGELEAGSPMYLKPDLNNSYDKNAVSVWSKSYKLGHISKELSSKYKVLFLGKKITNCAVNFSDTPIGSNAVKLKISITYLTDPETSYKIDLSGFKNHAGTYEIIIKGGRLYIGSSKNIYKRFNQHLSELASKRHSNDLLQADFIEFGKGSIHFNVLKYFNDHSDALEYEKQEILKRINNGVQLYNMTTTGVGFINNKQNQTSNSVSDRKYTNFDNIKKQPELAKPKHLRSEDDPINFYLLRRLNHTLNIKYKEAIEKEDKLLKISFNWWNTQYYGPSKYSGRLTLFSQKPHGIGVIKLTDGSRYAGGFNKGIREDHGTYIFSGGDKYVGEWKDGKRHGQGAYTWADGTKYVGEWKDSKKDGFGFYTPIAGKEYAGKWKEGILIKSSTK